MKILITGMNKNQCTRKFFLRQQLKVVPSHYSLYNCLVDMGHEVEQKSVDIGEDISSYDKVIIFIAGPRQLVATHVFNGLWALSQRPDAILAFDDWQVPDLYKGIQKCLDPKELFADFILGTNKTTIEEQTPYLQDYLRALELIVQKKNRILISAFSTSHLDESCGAHLLFKGIEIDPSLIYTYNPNPYHRNRNYANFGHLGTEDPEFTDTVLLEDPYEKEFRFNFASLVQSKTTKWLKKQGFTAGADDESGFIGSWPVDLYGSKADTQKRLTEDEMCKTIGRNWGCLMPGYDHSGSGWWRQRPLGTADVKSVLIGEPKEMQIYYGADFKYLNIKAIDLVAMDVSEISQMALSQYHAINTIHPLNKQTQVNELQKVLE